MEGNARTWFTPKQRAEQADMPMAPSDVCCWGAKRTSRNDVVRSAFDRYC
jgi:hypothetical protein